MTRTRNRLRIALLLVAAIATSLGACRRDRPQTRSSGAKKGTAAEHKVPVRVDRIRRGAIETALRYPGELKAPDEVEIAAEISGRIEAIKVRMGQRVKAGELLVVIDDAQLRSQQQESRASVQVARSTLKRAEVEDRSAATELARKAPLVKKDLITRQELDNVRTRRETAAASLAVARAQVAQATARVSLLAKQLGDARIRAPFSGAVQARLLDAGAVVTPGKAILRLVRTQPIVALFRVGERQIGAIRQRMEKGGLSFRLGVDSYPRRVFDGRVARVAPALDAASRTVAVEGELLNEDGLLMPGMFCRVELPLGRRDDVLLLPLVALIDGASARGSRKPAAGAETGEVFVVHQGRARMATVYLGGSNDRLVEVLRGLEAGAEVVVEGQDKLQSGLLVDVVGRGANAAASSPAPDSSASSGDAR